MQDSLGTVYTIVDDGWSEAQWPDVASADGCTVTTFRDLLDHTARLRFHNPHLNLFFRGQGIDYRRDYEETQSVGRISSLRPSGYRDSDIEKTSATSREHYFDNVLPTLADALLEELLETAKGGANRARRLCIKSMAHFRETLWSVLQHYLQPTPLLDVTTYLPVACSFAMRPTEDSPTPTEGFVYVLGLPQLHGLITYSPADSLVLVNLQSACPPETERPHRQHGYLVGSLPHNAQPETYLYRDFALRLVCKFKIVDQQGEFWNDTSTFWHETGYRPLSVDLLEPAQDQVKDIIDRIVP